MDTVQGDLANDRTTLPALVHLLNTATIAKLLSTPPVSRGADEKLEMREPMPAMVPGEAALVAEALGGQRADIEAMRGRRRSTPGSFTTT